MKISEPGIYDIPIEEYHGDPCDGPSISSSGLRALLLECPAKYWATSPLNPNRFEEKRSEALDIGAAAHCLTLGEPEFNKYFIVSPFDNFQTKAAREWRDEQTRTVIRKEDFDRIEIVSAVQKRSAQVMRAFEHGKPEMSLIWKDEETGVWLKARPDWLPNKPKERFIVEYKTAVSINPRKWSSDAFKFGYHMQAAMQIDGIKAVMGVDPIGVAHVVQEKDPPYLAELRLFGPEQIEDGRFMYRRALKIFARCYETGEWPGYTDEPSYVETPLWFAAYVERMRNEPDSDDKPSESASEYDAADYLTAG